MSDTVKDYRVELRLRNNRILKHIEALGFKTRAEFCRAYGLHYSQINDLVCMREPALKAKKNRKGGWEAERAVITRLTDIFGCSVEDLFNDRQLIADFKATKTVAEMDEPPVLSLEHDEVKMLTSPETPAHTVAFQDAQDAIGDALHELSPREEQCLRLRYGLGGAEEHTLEQLGDIFKVTRERVRQIEAKALRKLKHPSRKNALLDALDAMSQ